MLLGVAEAGAPPSYSMALPITPYRAKPWKRSLGSREAPQAQVPSGLLVVARLLALELVLRAAGAVFGCSGLGFAG